ncbi:MAG: hypothetical protein JO247_01155 [Chloroflexi bacterium]|nr:hypothetical protein [Chloroflexota bacterium]
MPVSHAHRLVAALLWGLALYDSLVCRGLFWDGASFLVNIIDSGTFHDFYPARAHIGWVTQLPVLLLLKAGVTDTRVLAMVQSAALFALPVGLYHFALVRVRHDRLLLATVMVVISLVYLPTSFFIVGEYNALYAAATAAMAIVVTHERRRPYDGALLAALAVLSVRSYEAMVYIGPLLVAACLWWRARLAAGERGMRALAAVAALGFAGGAAVSAATLVEYWNHPHFVLVRAAIPDFWQDLQFVVPLAGLLMFGLASLAWPVWLKTRLPVALIAVVAAVLVSTLGFRHWLDPEAMVFPPSHYVARTAAGGMLSVLLIALWMQAAWRKHPPRLLTVLRDEVVGRRLVTAMVGLLLAAAVPDVALTRLWNGYLGYFRHVVESNSGFVSASTLPDRVWPYWLFNQRWTAPALSALVRSAPGQAIVLAEQGTAAAPFDSRCGTLPRLDGYWWRP